MRRQTTSRPQSGYRGHDGWGESGSSDGAAYSTSSGGSNIQPGFNRPVINPTSNPLSRVRTPEQHHVGPSHPRPSTAPATPVRETSSFTLNGHHINETYKRRPSVNASPSRPSFPVSPALRTSSPRQRAYSQHVANRPLVRNTRRHWVLDQELKLKIFRIPKLYWTKDVYLAMCKFGTVIRVDMEVGSQDNNAWVVFQ